MDFWVSRLKRQREPHLIPTLAKRTRIFLTSVQGKVIRESDSFEITNIVLQERLFVSETN